MTKTRRISKDLRKHKHESCPCGVCTVIRMNEAIIFTALYAGIRVPGVLYEGRYAIIKGNALEVTEIAHRAFDLLNSVMALGLMKHQKRLARKAKEKADKKAHRHGGAKIIPFPITLKRPT